MLQRTLPRLGGQGAGGAGDSGAGTKKHKKHSKKGAHFYRGGQHGSPGKRRLWAGVTGTLPNLTYRTEYHPYAQFVMKKITHTNSLNRIVPDRQLYATLQWANHDDTPTLLHRSSADLEGYGKAEGDYWDGYHFTAGRFRPPFERRPLQFAGLDLKTLGVVQYPLVPEDDTRTLSNAEWRRSDRQERLRHYLQKHQLFHVFPDVSASLNMNVNYGGDAPRAYWRSVFSGNYVELRHVLSAPRVMVPDDGIDPDARYCLAMFTPDHPFRAAPEEGHCLHWLVANIRCGDERGADGDRRDAAAEGDTVVPYLHPLPSEDAGCLRYVFALFRQERAVELPAAPAAPLPLARRRHFRLHAPPPAGPDGLAPRLAALYDAGLSDAPDAVSFFHTDFDYAVADWYAAAGEPEPLYVPGDVREEMARYVRKERHFAAHTPYSMKEHFQATRVFDRDHVYSDV